ncbi:hypothetical protein [Novosphingobium sp.]|uniref:hypothetical protein n=1 Tax=Novosphingobium sp. TaxID=1874826 RepID=UPI0025E7A38E|nr:hypothetical protein [Novosphingobium sp.]
MAAIDARQDRLTAAINLYEALGGRHGVSTIRDVCLDADLVLASVRVKVCNCSTPTEFGAVPATANKA